MALAAVLLAAAAAAQISVEVAPLRVDIDGGSRQHDDAGDHVR
jgi:hypothetical protein